MKRFKEKAVKFVAKYGSAIAACAFAFVTISANTPCGFPYYEPQEPAGLDRFKKFN
jgi:cyclic lactone autoinducer peptide